MEIMWGLQQQLHALLPRGKSKLAKEDRLPTSQGLMKFLSNCGFDVRPEMVSSLVGLDMLSALLFPAI
jgi:nucleolar protein 58